MTTATVSDPTSPDFFDGIGKVVAAVFAGVVTIIGSVAALLSGLRKSSKSNGTHLQGLARSMQEALDKVVESNRAIVSRLDQFEARTTARLDRLETDVAGLRDLQRMEADLRVAMERIEHLKSDVERLGKAAHP